MCVYLRAVFSALKLWLRHSPIKMFFFKASLPGKRLIEHCACDFSLLLYK